MFHILHKDNPQQDVEDIVTDSSFQVSKEKQIEHLLNHAHKSQALLLTHFADQSEQFTTALLGIYPKHGFLVLDELSPKKGHKLFLEDKKCKVTGKLDGVELRFTAHLIEARDKAGIAFYKTSIPKTLFYRQRRKDFRISTGALNIPFHSRHDEHTIHGSVADISRNGIGIIINEEIHISPGEMLPTCTVTIPNQGEILFSLEARVIQHNRQHNSTRIGGCFTRIDSQSRRHIVRLITELERQQCKRMRRG